MLRYQGLGIKDAAVKGSCPGNVLRHTSAAGRHLVSGFHACGSIQACSRCDCPTDFGFQRNALGGITLMSIREMKRERGSEGARERE